MGMDELLALQARFQQEIHQLENPGLLKRLERFGAKATAAALGIAATLVLADRAYLGEQAKRAAAMPEASQPNRLRPLHIVTDLDTPTPEGMRMVWSCENCACPKGMGGQCFPTYVDEKEPIAANYQDVTAEHIATFRTANPNHPAQVVERFLADGDQYKNPDIHGLHELAGLTRPTSATATHDSAKALRALKNQTILTTLGASGIGAALYQLAARWLDTPRETHTHHLKHELQHVEDVLAFRSKSESSRPTIAKNAA